MATQFSLESSDRDADDHYVHLQILGDGDLEHYLGAFKAFLLAVGYVPETVNDVIRTEAFTRTDEEFDDHERPSGAERWW